MAVYVKSTIYLHLYDIKKAKIIISKNFHIKTLNKRKNEQ